MRSLARTRRRGAMARAPRRLRRLSTAELLLLAQAPVALPVTALALWLLGLRRVQSLLGRRSTCRAKPLGAAGRDEALRLAWIVEVSAVNGPWRANCLQRSVVLWWYLRRRGLDGELRIGVRRAAETGELDFHAWVEHGGVVINDRADIRSSYATFPLPIAPRSAGFR